MLQKNPDLLKVVPSSCCETCLTTSEDGNEVISIKEETQDAREGEVPLRMSLPIIMAKCGVSHIRMLTLSRLMSYIYMSYRTANLHMLHFKYLFNKCPY
jgi:hypothetical protein